MPNLSKPWVQYLILLGLIVAIALSVLLIFKIERYRKLEHLERKSGSLMTIEYQTVDPVDRVLGFRGSGAKRVVFALPEQIEPARLRMRLLELAADASAYQQLRFENLQVSPSQQDFPQFTAQQLELSAISGKHASQWLSALISSTQSLETLIVEHTPDFADQQLRLSLKQPGLSRLVLHNVPVSGVGFDALSDGPRRLALELRVPLTDEGLKQLARPGTVVESVRLDLSAQEDLPDLTRLLTASPQVKLTLRLDAAQRTAALEPVLAQLGEHFESFHVVDSSGDSTADLAD